MFICHCRWLSSVLTSLIFNICSSTYNSAKTQRHEPQWELLSRVSESKPVCRCFYNFIAHSLASSLIFSPNYEQFSLHLPFSELQLLVKFRHLNWKQSKSIKLYSPKKTLIETQQMHQSEKNEFLVRLFLWRHAVMHE